ncbi:MAG: YjhX family toxin [Devosia sp.]
MDISRDEQRVLHALAQGGFIKPLKTTRGRIGGLELYNRDGWLMPTPPLLLFKKLQRKKAIKSQNSEPYRITRRGLELVRSEVDNR